MMKLSDIDIEFVSTNSASSNKNSKNNPQNYVIRYQLMEILVRITLRKYLKGKRS
jgi:hypothetical protein